MTRDFFNRQYSAMLAVYAGAQKPDEAQDIYWEMLRGVPDKAFHFAVRKCLEGCKFFPTIAELLEASRNMPPARLKMLDEPRPDPKQVEQGRKMLMALASKMGRRL